MSLSPRLRLARAVGTVGGLGLLRPAPGTWGSAATVAAVYALTTFCSPWAVVGLLVVASSVGLWAAGLAPDFAGSADPGEVVIDEVAGQTLALLPVAFGAAGAAAHGVALWQLWPGWLGGFLLFRLFDIRKPWLIGRVDRRGDALGLMGDDLLAGLAAALCVMATAGLWHGVLRL